MALPRDYDPENGIYGPATKRAAESGLLGQMDVDGDRLDHWGFSDDYEDFRHELCWAEDQHDTTQGFKRAMARFVNRVSFVAMPKSLRDDLVGRGLLKKGLWNAKTQAVRDVMFEIREAARRGHNAANPDALIPGEEENP